jgi:hypothetical protein
MVDGKGRILNKKQERKNISFGLFFPTADL